MYLEKAIFINRAPFVKLELDFSENAVAVLTAINGRGKTTILSYIVDAFYEMARPHFPNEFEQKQGKLYRISSPLYNINQNNSSFVYLRFRADGDIIDYLDIRNNCTEEQYNTAITIVGKIPYNQIKSRLEEENYIKKVSSNFNKKKAIQLYFNNLLTYFPSYRFELPGYLNDPYKVTLSFSKDSLFSGYLNNPIEVVTGLKQLANWIMDIVLDLRVEGGIFNNKLFQNLNLIITKTLLSKNYGNLRFGVGPRGSGSTRIQILKNIENGETIYPTIFNLSSGESAILCLFGELLRQADNNNNNIQLHQITGIVLIDEVDKHLHIRLQKEVLPNLFKLFPNVQFIVSSHSPFLSMGLAEQMYERSIIVDLDNYGILKDPSTNELYLEVYNMMVNENARFMKAFQSIKVQIQSTKKLQIITEGKNTEYIEKAIQILDPTLTNEIQIIKGSEDKTGSQQLKNAFDILSKGNHFGKFLFVWDCDAASLVTKVIETENFKKFSFQENSENIKARDTDGTAKGIENLFPDTFFTEDVYKKRDTKIAYGGSKTEVIFNKGEFLNKVKQATDKEIFKNFLPLISKIKETIGQ